MNDEKKEALDEIRVIAGRIPIGETERVLCTLCRGGRTRESSLSITRRDKSTAVFLCYRATCNFRGFSEITGTGFVSSSSSYKRPLSSEFCPELYTGGLRLLDAKELSHVLDFFGITEKEVTRASWRMAVEQARLVIPIRCRYGLCRGVESRRVAWSESNGPKTRVYTFKDEPRMGWYRNPSAKAVLIVEDCISCLKGARFFDSCFLLGTTLSQDKMDEVVKIANGRVIAIALDRDAVSKANEYLKKYNLMAGGNLKVIPLSKDLKYCDDEEIKKMLELVVDE